MIVCNIASSKARLQCLKGLYPFSPVLPPPPFPLPYPLVLLLDDVDDVPLLNADIATDRRVDGVVVDLGFLTANAIHISFSG